MSVFDTLALKGFVFPEGKHLFANQSTLSHDMLAMDAAPGLTTSTNAGIPAFMNSYVDPDLINVAFSPMRGADLAGEQKKGDWTTSTALFPMMESTGEVAAYGDFNNDGEVGINTDFPDRQAYHYQAFGRWGELAVERAGEARIGYVAGIRRAQALKLNKFQNQSYFFGVAGLRNYGYLNDPLLKPSVPASTKAAGGSSWQNGTPEEITNDVIAAITQLRQQSAGYVTTSSKITIGLSPTRAGMLTKPNQFGLSPWDQLKKQYSGLTFVEAIEFGDLQAQPTQMLIALADEVDGRKVATAAFTEKLRAHSVVTHSSSWSQKMSQGTFGAIIFVPAGVASVTGI